MLSSVDRLYWEFCSNVEVVVTDISTTACLQAYSLPSSSTSAFLCQGFILYIHTTHPWAPQSPSIWACPLNSRRAFRSRRLSAACCFRCIFSTPRRCLSMPEPRICFRSQISATGVKATRLMWQHAQISWFIQQLPAGHINWEIWLWDVKPWGRAAILAATLVQLRVSLFIHSFLTA